MGLVFALFLLGVPLAAAIYDLTTTGKARLPWSRSRPADRTSWCPPPNLAPVGMFETAAWCGWLTGSAAQAQVTAAW